MAEKLTHEVVKNLPIPANRYQIHFDSDIPGFGCRVTPKGTKAFVLTYRHQGRPIRHTIGRFPAWSVAAARKEAEDLRKRVDRGENPQAERAAHRSIDTIAALADRFIEEHAKEKLRPKTVQEYQRAVEKHIKNDPIGKLDVATVDYSDIARAHTRWTKKSGPYAANRAVALLSSMFNKAAKWGMRDASSNPAKGIERNQEQPHERYLTPEEMARLSEALTAYPNAVFDGVDTQALSAAALADLERQHGERSQTANIVRLAILTGARKGELLAMEWLQLDLDGGTWTKPASNTKQKKLHRAPLSSAALELLKNIKASQPEGERYVFPGRKPDTHQSEPKTAWSKIRKIAKIEDVRFHDLRHSYASQLVSAGISLPIIGALLGHSQVATTARYAHLYDDPLRSATEIIGASVSGAAKAQVTNIREAKR